MKEVGDIARQKRDRSKVCVSGERKMTQNDAVCLFLEQGHSESKQEMLCVVEERRRREGCLKDVKEKLRFPKRRRRKTSLKASEVERVPVLANNIERERNIKVGQLQ